MLSDYDPASGISTVDYCFSSVLIQARAAVDGPNAYGLTPLFLAASGGDLDVAQSLRARGADARKKTKTGHSPLMAAAGAGHAAIVERLLDDGVDVNASTSDGQTALLLAVARGSASAAQSLLRHGADVNARDARGRTPLQVAEENRDEAMVRCLRKDSRKR